MTDLECLETNMLQRMKMKYSSHKGDPPVI